MSNIHATYYTKEKGKEELTEEQWIDYDFSKVTLHRDSGPAVEFADGSKWWYINDKLHRVDGPAVEWIDGDKEWYINNKRYTEEEYNTYLQEIDSLPLTLQICHEEEWIRERAKRRRKVS